MNSNLKCTWKAIHDFEPPQPPRLIVSGECTVPTPGYLVELSEAVPQGVNPLILILNMKVTPPEGVVPQHVTTVQAVFEKQTDFRYQEVFIVPGEVRIPVQNVT